MFVSSEMTTAEGTRPLLSEEEEPAFRSIYGTQGARMVYGREVKPKPVFSRQGPCKFLFKSSHCVAVSVVLVVVVVTVAVTLHAGIGQQINEQAPSPRGGPLTLTLGSSKTVFVPYQVADFGDFPRAAVASNSEECSDIARDVMAQNGSAVDAAIAGILCLGVVHPHHSGIGGGLVMTIYDRLNKKAVVIDGRETAPSGLAAANLTRQPLFGGLSIGVPGALSALWTAHKQYGKLPWADVVQPAVKLCLEGFRVDETLAKILFLEKGRIWKEPSLREVFVNATSGELYQLNDTITNPSLGNTLQAIATNGALEFYQGTVAVLLAKDILGYGGRISLLDLATYAAVVRSPVVSQVSGGLRVYGAPPPANGIGLAFILNVLKGYDWSSVPKASALVYHRLAEAFKFAAAFRPLLADPDFEDISQLVVNLTSDSFADAIRARISDSYVLPVEEYGWTGVELQPSHGTSQLSLVDPDGNAVSVSSTLNDRFGAKIRSQSTGIFLNNQMADFSSIGPNSLVAGKRPASSMTPTIIVDDNSGDVRLVTGSSGGRRITTATAFVTAEHLFLGLPLQNATDLPRLHHQLLPNVLEVEAGLPPAVLLALQQKGHEVADILYNVGPSAVNSVSSAASGLRAVADRRSHGGVAGF